MNRVLSLALAVFLWGAGTVSSVLAATLPQALDGPGIVSAASSGAALWSGEDIAASSHDGIDAARSGGITHGGTTQLSTVVTGPGSLRFWWKVSSERTYDFGWWRLDGGPRPPISGESGWIEVTAMLTGGNHTVEFFYQKDSTVSAGADALWVDQLRVDPLVSVGLAQALDLSSPRVFASSDGANPWSGFAAPAETHDGIDAARSGGSSGLSNLNLNVTGPGILSAWVALNPRQLSSSDPHFTMTAARRLLGWIDTTQWKRVEVEIPHGEHGVVWRWEDGSTPLQPEGAGYVDQVSFVAANTTTLQQALDGAGLTWTTDLNREWGGLMAPMSNHDGTDAARSATTYQSGPTGLQTTVTGPGVVTFWWRADGLSGEQSSMLVDDYVVRRIILPSGGSWTGTWWPESVSVAGAGTHTLRWEFSNPLEGGCVWLDEVSWTPGGYVSIPVGDAAGAPALFGIQPVPGWQGLQGPGLGRDGSAAKSENTFAAAATLRATVTGPGTVSWWWRSDETTPVIVNLDSVTRFTENLTRAWTRAVCSIPPGTHTLDWRHNATGAAYVDEVVFTPATEAEALPEAVEAQALVWRSSGPGGPWFRQTQETHDGSDAARASPTPDGGIAWIETDVTGPGVLRFAWKVSCEARATWLPFASGDNLTFSSTSTISPGVSPIEGESGWTVQEVAINSPGTQTLRWTYVKNGSLSAGLDTAWLDAVTFTPAGPVSLGEAVDSPALTWTTGGSGAWTGTAGDGSAQQGMDFARSTPSASPGISWLEAVLPDGGLVTYYCRYTGPTGSMRVLLDGQSVATIPADLFSTSWLKLAASAPSRQAHVLRFECDNSSGSWQIDNIQITPGALAIGEALDAPEQTWTQSGLGGWGGVAAPGPSSHDGVDVARAFERAGTLQTITGPVALSFWWRKDLSGAALPVTANGLTFATIGVQNEWQRVQADIPIPGASTLTWTGSGMSLDEMAIAPLTAVPLDEALDGSGLTWQTSPAAPWSGWRMTSASADGVDAAAGGTALAAVPSWIEAQWTGAGAIAFRARAGAPGMRDNIFEISRDGGAAAPFNQTTWAREMLIVSAPGPHTARWSARTGVNSATAAGAMLDEVTFHPALLLADALDAPALTWSTGGSAAWIGLSEAAALVASNGDVAACDIGPGEQTWLETTLSGPGMLRSQVLLKESIGALAFAVDGVQQWSSASFYSWTTRTQVIGPGSHVIRWTLSRTAGAPAVGVRAFLDGVTFTPAASVDLPAALDSSGLPLRTGGASGWLNQSDLTRDGVDALQSDFVGAGPETWVEFDVTGEQFITFHTAALALPPDTTGTVSAQLKLTLDGTRHFSDRAPTDGTWRKTTVRTQGAGPHTLRITLLPNTSTATQFSLVMDQLAVEPLLAVPLSDALEWPAFTTGADAPWQGFAAAAPGFDRVDFAAPGNLDFATTTWLETTAAGPGRFRFRQRATTPSGNYEAIAFVRRFRLNGSIKSVSGDVVDVDLPAGPNMLRWEYTRTGAATYRAPDWHLDQFSFTPGTTLAEALDAPSRAWTSGAGWRGLLSATDSHDGTDVAAAEEITPETDYWLEASFPGPGVITFMMRRGATAPVALSMLVFGQPAAWTLEATELSGWERASVVLPARQQTVRWNFRAAAGSASGSGAVFLDEPTFAPPPPVSLPAALDAEDLEWVTGPNAWEGFASAGTDWALSRDVAPGERSWVETTVPGPGLISYRAGVFGDPVNPGTLKVWLPSVMSSDEEFIVRGDVGWRDNLRVYLSGSGTQRVRWTYRDRSADSGNTASSATLDAISFTAALPFSETFDTPDLTWTTNPENPWIGVNDAYSWPDFPLHAVSGPSGGYVPSWIETVVTGPASLRFDWMTSGSNMTDGSLWVDETLLHVMNESGPWRLIVPAGAHSVRWQRRFHEPLVTSGARLANVALQPWPGDIVDMPDAPWLLREPGWTFLTGGSHDGVDGLSLSGPGPGLIGRISGPGIFTSWQSDGGNPWTRSTETISRNESTAIRRSSGGSGQERRHDEFAFQPAPAVTLGEALDAPGMTWTTGGAAPWQGFGPPLTSTEGGDAAAAGIVGSGEESWMETSVTGPGRMTFFYTASTTLTWGVDGLVSPLPASGPANAQGFLSAALQLPAGVHAIRWTQRCPANLEESLPVSLDRVVFTTDVSADDLAEALDATAWPWSVSGITTWRAQSGVSHDGSDAAAATQYMGQILQTAVPGPGTASFWWRREPGDDYNFNVTFQANSEALLYATPNTGWQRLEYLLPGSGPQILKWNLNGGGGPWSASDFAWIDQFSFIPAPVVTLPEAVDAPELIWETSPGAPWTGVAGAAFSGDGSDAAVAGAPSPGNDSWLETQVFGPGTVSFLWRRSAGTSALLCEIDGQLRGSATNVDFKPATFEFLTGGDHTVRWRLQRAADSDPAGAAAVDAFVFTPLPDDVTFHAFAAAYLPDALRDPEADIDGDGLTNLVEYAHGLDPASDDAALVSAPLGLPVIRLVTGGDGQRYCELLFPRRRHASGLSQVAEFSTGADGPWNASSLAPVVTPFDADWETVTVRDSVPVAATTRRFGRVSVMWQMPEY